jgi:phenolic acid decarboxylase
MKILNLKSPIFSEFAIVDNEISNDISDKFDDWHYEKADIICCGIFYQNDIIILFREKNENLEEYKETLKANLMKFDCFFAFNRSMNLEISRDSWEKYMMSEK